MAATRRGLLASFLGGFVARAAAQSGPPAAGKVPAPLVQALADDLAVLARNWDRRRERIRTPKDMRRRIRFVRERLRAMLGPLEPLAPLSATVCGVLRRSGFRIEKLLFQSAPGVWVSASLYVPEGDGPFPAVVSPCGHYEAARAHPDYQRAYVDLASCGFVVLAYDPPGQGERRAYWDPATGKAEHGIRSVDEHSLLGHLMLLFGENLTGFMVQEGMRAVDYLLSRPEVDPRRIACAGHSGGGTLTMYLACADERIGCVVINEGGTFHRWPVKFSPTGNAPVADAEQNVFPAAVYGIDACDLHIAVAPRPLLALIEEYGPEFLLTASHIRRAYELLGVGARFQTGEARARHAWTEKLRLLTADFCSRWLAGRPGPSREPEIPVEDPVDLWCTPQGSLAAAGRGRTLYSWLREKAALQNRNYPVFHSPEDLERWQRKLRERLPRLLRFEKRPQPGFRQSGGSPSDQESIEILTGTPINLQAVVLRPEKSAPPLMPVIEVAEIPRVKELHRRLNEAGHWVVVAGVRSASVADGNAPSSPSPVGHLFSQETAAAYMAWWMDRSLCGMRVQDVLQSVEVIRRRLIPGAGKVALLACGAAAVWATFAAVLTPQVSALICEDPLISYRALVDAGVHVYPAGVLVPGILREMDLPQVAAAVAPRRLAFIAPRDGRGRPASSEQIASVEKVIRAAYQAAGNSAGFTVWDTAGPADYLRLLRREG